MNALLLSVLLSFGGPWHDKVKHPKCDGVDNWAASMAYVHLKNKAMIGPGAYDPQKTTCSRIASQQIGKDLFRQVHMVTFTKTSGEIIQVITVNDASTQECSMSGVEVYVISNKLGGF